MESKITYFDTAKRYIIFQIWVSPLENKVRDAVGYNIVGYTETGDEAEEFCNQGRDYDVNDCWAIQGSKPEFIYQEVKLIREIC